MVNWKVIKFFAVQAGLHEEQTLEARADVVCVDIIDAAVSCGMLVRHLEFAPKDAPDVRWRIVTYAPLTQKWDRWEVLGSSDEPHVDNKLHQLIFSRLLSAAEWEWNGWAPRRLSPRTRDAMTRTSLVTRADWMRVRKKRALLDVYEAWAPPKGFAFAR